MSEYSLQKKQAFELANSGKLVEAQKLLTELSTAQQPDVDVWFLLGAVCGALGQLDKSVVYLKKVVKLKHDHIDALYNLGTAYLKKEEYENSLNCSRKVIELNNEHHDARYNVAVSCCNLEKYSEAIPNLKILRKVWPSNASLRNYYAQALFAVRDYRSTISELEAIVLEDDSNLDAYKLLGDAWREVGQNKNAAIAYKQVMKIKSEDADIYRELGVSFKSMEMYKEAIQCFRKALKIQPDMINVKYHLATLGEMEAPGKAPADYVTKLFNTFSGNFEDKLINDLGYKTPFVINDLLRKHLPKDAKTLNVLDLGCGTGLCGPIISDLCGKLVGVDLSEGMIEVARTKGVYDELIVGDITEKLFPDSARFDLIVAADVFVYIGDLAPIFEVSRVLLEDGGIFIFSTEKSARDDVEYELQTTGRYKHSSEYLSGLATQCGFRITEVTSTQIRENKKIPVMGDLFLLQNS